MPFLVAARGGAIAQRTLTAIANRVPGVSPRILSNAAGSIAIAFPANLVQIFRRVVNNPAVRAAAAVFGGLSIVDSFIEADIPGVPSLPGLSPGTPEGLPGQVVKSWTANGVPMARLADGRMAAYSKKRGTWKLWRPKKPIVIYASGSSDLRTLLRADKSVDNQLRRVKKVIDRRYPRRTQTRRRTEPQTIIQESGSGGVQHARRS